MTILLLIAQLLSYSMFADLEIWAKNVDSMLHRTSGNTVVEYGHFRVFAGYSLQMTELTKENRVHFLNAEAGSNLIKRHGVNLFTRVKNIEIGIKFEKESAHKFNSRHQFWYNTQDRQNSKSAVTIGYYHGTRFYLKHANFEIYLPPILFSYPTMGYPLIQAKVKVQAYSFWLQGTFAGPYRVPYKGVSYVPVFDVQIAYGVGLTPFIRIGRVHIPLAIETRMQRIRTTIGIKIEIKK